MTNNPTKNNQKSGLSWYFWIALILLLSLICLWLMGYGPWGKFCKENAVANNAQVTQTSPVATVQSHIVPAAPVQAPVIAAASAIPAVPAAAQAVSQAPLLTPAKIPEARIYFRIDRKDVPPDVDKTLNEVVKYMQKNASSKVQLTGFHDASGSKEHNIELAMSRSGAVKTSLVGMGVTPERIEILKPSETTGTGQPSEARRVEVRVTAK